jgi:hypothetical protein
VYVRGEHCVALSEVDFGGQGGTWSTLKLVLS